ncbi:hypothetical protein JJO83_13100 [Halomonas aquamarina]|uniref:hypothetical protein n=1 Tax=Vreelandella aquamarina TaxID=77097 RepID=UPI00235A3CAE|nr:hypothetical protein [Halomonas aquamarina]MDC8443626.1 hypothetical protein [Halomonas aquamarina]
MNSLVYYLCFFSQGGGFLFPDELPPDYYSPGLFLIEPNQNGEYPYSFSFDAMDNGKRVSLNLVRADEGNPRSTLYVVRTKHYGSFWFNLERVNPFLPYLGTRPQLKNHRSFGVAITTDSVKLERVCHKFDFYFIGSTLREEDL